VEGGPAAAAVAHEPGIVLLPPREAVRAVVCAGPGHTVGAPPGGAAQATAGLDEVRHGAPGGALGAEGGELVPGWAAQCARAGGRGGGRGGPARGPRVAGLGHGAWRDGPADEARRMAPRGPAAPLRACQAHRHRWAVAARAEGLAPGVPLGRALGQAQPLPVCRARGWEAALVGRRRPGAAHTGRTGGGGVWRQGCAPAVGSRGAKGHACWRSVKACERAGGAAASEEAWTNARAPADAQRGAQASRASAGLCVIRRGLCLLSLPAPCQVWTVSLQQDSRPITVLQWFVEAAEQRQAFPHSCLCAVHIQQWQLDAWSAVIRDLQKGESRAERAIKRLEPARRWVGTAIAPESTRLLALDAGARPLEMAQGGVHQVVRV